MMSESYFGLHNLKASPGARHAPKRLGRGEGSGHGKTCGKGHKGQKARKSGNVRRGFQGGQNTLMRSLPKRGFTNIFAQADYVVVNVGRLADRFNENAVVDPAVFMATGMTAKVSDRVKVLSNGDINFPINLHVHAISQTARDKIEKAGGKVEIIGRSES